VNLGPSVNSKGLDFRPGISFDGKALYFHSDRPSWYGGSDLDLYVATRTKIKTN
jgi:hypothetical protein